jgi:hypothetical protein
MANAHGKRVSDTRQEPRIAVICKIIFRKELATNGAGRISAEAFREVNGLFMIFLIWRILISGM